MSEKKTDPLRELQECVLDMCALLDVAGERLDVDPREPGDESALDYFCTVSKNIGLARVAIEQDIGPDYYAARYQHYKRPALAGSSKD